MSTSSASEAKLEWIVSYSSGQMETPDLKVFYNNYSERITAIDSLAEFTSASGDDLTAEALELIGELIDDGAIPENWASDTEGTLEVLQSEGSTSSICSYPLMLTLYTPSTKASIPPPRATSESSTKRNSTARCTIRSHWAVKKVISASFQPVLRGSKPHRLMKKRCSAWPNKVPFSTVTSMRFCR